MGPEYRIPNFDLHGVFETWSEGDTVVRSPE
jgi:hypothetical protein